MCNGPIVKFCTVTKSNGNSLQCLQNSFVEDTACWNYKTWRNQAGSDLPGSFHSARGAMSNTGGEK